MTALLVAAIILSASAGAAITHACWTRWAETHHYRQVRLETLRVDRLYRDRDHFEREARRERHRAWLNRQLVGDLTVQLAHARHRQPRRSPVPAYGAHRHKVSA